MRFKFRITAKSCLGIQYNIVEDIDIDIDIVEEDVCTLCRHCTATSDCQTGCHSPHQADLGLNTADTSLPSAFQDTLGSYQLTYSRYSLRSLVRRHLRRPTIWSLSVQTLLTSHKNTNYRKCQQSSSLLQSVGGSDRLALTRSNTWRGHRTLTGTVRDNLRTPDNTNQTRSPQQTG